jgi:hypothetical protein
MPHQSDAAALGGATEERNLGLVGTKFVGIKHGSGPSFWSAGAFHILNCEEMRVKASISLDCTPPTDLKKRHSRRSKEPMPPKQ